MNRLQEKLLILIFKRLDLLQLLKLRAVCVRWKEIIESLRTKDLAVVDSQFNRREKWNTIGLEAVNYRSLLYYSKQSSKERLLTTHFYGATPDDP